MKLTIELATIAVVAIATIQVICYALDLKFIF